MAKRAGATATPSYQPITDSRRSNESGFQRFMREQIWAADKAPGNLSILIGTGFFAASIVATRLWGSMLLVPTTP
ncbi:hypothetical protein CPB86DRAFT_636359 [Serendipita vermifera]|nr:hypothetical protein CPB86DRAFT_636359 [Serendipita vermifera]